ncbi:MAG: inositol monophosphatase family protein [Armatimonadota bacterium]
MKKFLKTAKDAALSAGEYLKGHFGKKHTVSYKGKIDLITEVDKKSEDIISKIIRREFPDHALVGEEGTSVESGSGYRWFVDPLDGTTNFAHNFPVFCISIGLQKENEMITGVVYAPVIGELFYAAKGEGAYLGKKRLRVSKIKRIKESLLATGFPYWIKDKKSNKVLKLFKDFVMRAQAVRRAGAAAYDLASLAAGRFDGFWEEGLHPWDIAAGILIVKEAGGIFTDFKGGRLDLRGRDILASNGLIHKEMINVINS